MQKTAKSLKISSQTKHFLVHKTQKKNNNRQKSNITSKINSAIAYSHPKKKTPL